MNLIGPFPLEKHSKMQLKNCEKNQEASSDTKLFKQGNAGGPMRSSGHGPIVPNPAWKKSQNPKKAHKVAKPPPIPRQVRDQVNQEPPEYYFENGMNFLFALPKHWHPSG